MSGTEEESTDKHERRYEYEFIEIGSQQHRAESHVKEMAAKGWQLTETLGTKGTSDYLVFERPANDGGEDSE